jgi:hypothetical protein
MHARTKADADADADVKHAWWQRDQPTFGSANTPSVRATTFTPTKNKSQDRPADGSARRPSLHATALSPTQNKCQHTFPPRGDSHSLRRVEVATAGRGVTSPAPAGMHAHRQTQTPAQTSNMSGGDSMRDQPTDSGLRTLSVHVTIFTPAQSERQHASPRWGDSQAARRVGLATADCGVTVPAHAGMHAHRETRTPAQTSNMCRSDNMRDRPADGGKRTLSAHATTFVRAQNNSHTLRRDGVTHVVLAVLNSPPSTVAQLRPRMHACTDTGRRRRRRKRQTRVVATA